MKEVLLVKALVDGEEDEVLVFRVCRPGPIVAFHASNPTSYCGTSQTLTCAAVVAQGFSSSLVRPTPDDPDEPVLPAGSTITSIDRLQAPYNPAGDQAKARPSSMRSRTVTVIPLIERDKGSSPALTWVW